MCIYAIHFYVKSKNTLTYEPNEVILKGILKFNKIRINTKITIKLINKHLLLVLGDNNKYIYK